MEVTLIYRRQRAEMPALEEEIQAALEEGVRIIYLAAPLRLEGSGGRVNSIICQRMNLGQFDSSGRRRPLPIPGAEFSLPVDQVVVAVGQQTDLPFAGRDEGGEFSLTPSGLIAIQGFSRTRAGQALVFAGGDVVTGPATVIKAVAAGRWAAREIDQALRQQAGEQPSLLLQEEIPVSSQPPETVQGGRPAMPCLEVAERIAGFAEVETGLAPSAARAEARRCLRCDIRQAQD
jgi:NADH-quinone oxidoreductase subunit F